MKENNDASKKDKKSKVSIGKAFKTIIWPKRNLVFIGLILIVLSRLSSLVLPWKSKALLELQFRIKIMTNYTSCCW